MPQDYEGMYRVECERFKVPVRFSPRKFRNLMNREPSWVAVEDGRIIGYAIYEASLAVLRRYQGRGAARRLLGHELEWASKQGMRYNLHVGVRNVRALRLYEAMGFRVVRYLDGYGEDGSDSYLMRRE